MLDQLHYNMNARKTLTCGNRKAIRHNTKIILLCTLISIPLKAYLDLISRNWNIIAKLKYCD